MEMRDRYRDHMPIYVVCATVFPSDSIISMRLPDSASIFTAEVWAITKALEQNKDSVASKYIIFADCRHTFLYPCFTVYESGSPFHWCVFFKFCKKRHYILLDTQP